MNESLNGPLQLGILGAARIAKLFVEGVRPSAKVQVRAVASRDAERARIFARDCGIPQVHATYDSLLADSAIHAIYIPLPNNLHAEWSIRAVEAGKHVLCEKPLATSAADAEAMFAAAQQNNVYLVEGSARKLDLCLGGNAVAARGINPTRRDPEHRSDSTATDCDSREVARTKDAACCESRVRS